MPGYISVWELIISVMFLSQPSKRDETLLWLKEIKIHVHEEVPPTPPWLEAHKGSSAAVKGSFTAA